METSNIYLVEEHHHLEVKYKTKWKKEPSIQTTRIKKYFVLNWEGDKIKFFTKTDINRKITLIERRIKTLNQKKEEESRDKERTFR